VHGNNRLGGNSLLDCVVFGRVAGKHCAKYMLKDQMKEMDLKELSGGGLAADGDGGMTINFLKHSLNSLNSMTPLLSASASFSV